MSGEKVIVVGAGIAGLTAAFRLAKAGLDVTVLESGDRVGGRMSTATRDGYRIDLGASMLPGSYRQMAGLIAEAGLTDEIMPTSSLFGLLRDGRIHRFRAGSVRDMAAARFISTRSKLVLARAVADCVRLGGRLDWYDLSRALTADAESAPGYAARRLNSEIFEYLVEPTCVGMTLNSAEDNSAASFLFFLRRVMATRSLFNSATGIDFLPRGLARGLDVRLGATVTAVERAGSGATVCWRQPGEPDRSADAAACVIALPASGAAAIWQDCPAEQREFLRSVRYGRCVNVALALSAPPAEPASFLLTPRVEQPDLGAVVLDHNKAPGRAPDGRGLVTTYWRQTWSDPRADDDDDQVSADAIDNLSKSMPGLLTDVEWTHVQRWNPSIAVQFPGHLAALARFTRSFGERSVLQLAGDYFSGSTTNSSLCSGERAAQRVLTALGSGRTDRTRR